jgi:hypothetical protein
VIIAGQGNGPAGPLLNQALIDLAGAVQQLLNK